MRKLIVILVLFQLWCNYSCTDTTITDEIDLGETSLFLVRNIEPKSDNLIFFNMHENEKTSINAIRTYAKEHRINYIYLKHTGERWITFELQGTYSFDPNRIFTPKGRKATLLDGKNHSDSAQRTVAQFAKDILFELKDKKTIIAMHNNTDENYSIQSYMPDSSEAVNTKELFINPDMDPDDFIYTTVPYFYDALVRKGINVILQDNQNFADDGSLSVYCSINDVQYINIETEHDHLEKQLELMTIIHAIILESEK